MSNDWDMVALGDVLRQVSRSEAVQADAEYKLLGIRLDGLGAFHRETKLGAQISANVLFRVRSTDFVYSRLFAWRGAFTTVASALDGCHVSNEFPTFVPVPDKLDVEFLRLWFRLPTTLSEVEANCTGSTPLTRNRFKEHFFLGMQVPLPPLAEQRRIVARIEALAARIAEARGLRRQAMEEVEALSISSLRSFRLSLLASCPQIKRLGELTRVTSGGTPLREVPEYWDGDIPWIKTGELLDGDIYDAQECITQAGVENSAAKPFPRETVLIALYGQGQTRGRTGRLMIEAATNQACCAILPSPSLLEPRYTQYWLRSLYSDMREESHGGAQPNWNGQMIKNIDIALVSMPEQHGIVAYLDDLHAQVDALKRLQAETAAELDALLPSILDQAFKGEL